MSTEDTPASWDPIRQQAYIHFKCEPKTLGRYDIAASRRDPERIKKRERIDNTIERFKVLMSSGNPPATKQQAVKALSPFFAFLLSAFVRSVIEWLWERMEDRKS